MNVGIGDLVRHERSDQLFGTVEFLGEDGAYVHLQTGEKVWWDRDVCVVVATQDDAEVYNELHG